MMIKFGESGHPVFRATSPLSRGTLKSKRGGKLSFHFCADGDTIANVFRTIISVNQLSIYGAVSDLCEEYSICQTSTRRPCCGRAIRPIFRASRLIDNHTHTLEWDSYTRKSIAGAQRTRRKPSTTRSTEKMCTDAGWFLKTVEVGQYFMTKHTDEFLQSAEPVTCRECTLPKRWKIIWPERLDSREHQYWARVRSHNQLPAR